MYITSCWYALTDMYNQHKYSPLYAIILLLVTKAIAPGLVEVFSRLLMHAKYSFYAECAAQSYGYCIV